MNASKTRNPNRRQSPPVRLHPLGAVLRAQLEALVTLADEGHLDAPPAVLASLFALAALHLDGDLRKQAEDLAEWYDEEAQAPDAFAGRYTVTA